MDWTEEEEPSTTRVDFDLVASLRERGWDAGGDMLLLAAADEIERLRQELANRKAMRVKSS